MIIIMSCSGGLIIFWSTICFSFVFVCFCFPGLMGIPSDSSQQTHTSCSYQHSPSGTISTQNNLSNNQPNNLPNSHSANSGQVPLSHPAQAHPGHGSPHAPHLPQHGGPHNQHSQHAQHSQHSQHQQHSQHPQHAAHSQHGQHPSQHPPHGQHPQQHTPHPSQHTQHSQHPPQHGQQHQSLSHQPHPTQQQMACNTGKTLCLPSSCLWTTVIVQLSPPLFNQRRSQCRALSLTIKRWEIVLGT